MREERFVQYLRACQTHPLFDVRRVESYDKTRDHRTAVRLIYSSQQQAISIMETAEESEMHTKIDIVYISKF